MVDDLVQIRWIVCLFFFLNVIHSCVFKLLFAPFNRANNVTFWSAFECVPVLLAEWLYIQTIKYSVSALYPVIINTPTISCGQKSVLQFFQQLTTIMFSTANYRVFLCQTKIAFCYTNQDTIVGNNGVKTRWVNENHDSPVMMPMIEPTITWLHVWYCKYVLLKHTSAAKHQHDTNTNIRPARSSGNKVLLFMWCNLK